MAITACLMVDQLIFLRMWSPGQSHGRFYGLPPQDAHGVLEAPIDVDGGREDLFYEPPNNGCWCQGFM